MDTTNLYNTPQVNQAQTDANNAESTANAAATTAMTLPDQLKQALTTKFESNPLYGQRENALTNYLNTTTQAPLDYTAKSVGGDSDVVYNPLQQANLIQARKSAALVPLTTINDLLGIETGGLNNIIDSASRAAQAQVAGLQSNAQMARQKYQDIVDLISKQADENYRQKQLAMSASSSPVDLLSELMALYGGGNNTSSDSFWEDTGATQPQQKAKPKVTVKPVDLTGLNLSLGNNTGLGIPSFPTQNTSKPKKTDKSIYNPQFASLSQLGF